MKLKDLLKIIFSNGPLENGHSPFSEYRLFKDHIEMFRDMILECEEFMDVDELIVPVTPIFLMSENNPVNYINLKMVDGIRFKNKCYLHSIWVTEPMFDPSTLKFGKSYVKNGALITPTIYDEENFTPIKEIRLMWTPEYTNDVNTHLQSEEVGLRQRLHQILDDILDNPQEYSLEPYRQVVVRGIFEYDSPQEEIPYNIIL